MGRRGWRTRRGLVAVEHPSDREEATWRRRRYRDLVSAGVAPAWNQALARDLGGRVALGDGDGERKTGMTTRRVVFANCRERARGKT